MQELTTPERHALNIARKALRMNCTMANVMAVARGGATHPEARETVFNLTGEMPPIPEGCTCEEESP